MLEELFKGRHFKLQFMPFCAFAEGKYHDAVRLNALPKNAIGMIPIQQEPGSPTKAGQLAGQSVR